MRNKNKNSSINANLNNNNNTDNSNALKNEDSKVVAFKPQDITHNSPLL